MIYSVHDVIGETVLQILHSLQKTFVLHWFFSWVNAYIMIICSNIAVEEKAVCRSNTSVYYSERRGIIVTNFFIVPPCYFYRQSASAMHGRHRPVFLSICLRILLQPRYSSSM